MLAYLCSNFEFLYNSSYNIQLDCILWPTQCNVFSPKTMSCNRKIRGQHIYDGTIYIKEFKKEILETIYNGRVQLREDDVIIATYPKSG